MGDGVRYCGRDEAALSERKRDRRRRRRRNAWMLRSRDAVIVKREGRKGEKKREKGKATTSVPALSRSEEGGGELHKVFLTTLVGIYFLLNGKP